MVGKFKNVFIYLCFTFKFKKDIKQHFLAILTLTRTTMRSFTVYFSRICASSMLLFSSLLHHQWVQELDWGAILLQKILLWFSNIWQQGGTRPSRWNSGERRLHWQCLDRIVWWSLPLEMVQWWKKHDIHQLGRKQSRQLSIKRGLCYFTLLIQDFGLISHVESLILSCAIMIIECTFLT